MNVTTLLLPFDGSPAATRAAELLASYRAEPSAFEPHVLNVQARPIKLWPEATLDMHLVEAALIEKGRTTIKPAIERLAATGMHVHSAVRLGLAAKTILSEARRQNTEAIVMGTRGHGPLQGFALGSVALRVVHGGAAPLILVKPEDELPADLGRRLRVLLAMDGSEPALHAAERLVTWRAWLGELEVHLVHVQEPLTWLETVLPPHDDVMRQWSPAAGEAATQAARELFTRAGIVHHLHLAVGDAPQEVTRLAGHTKAELVALGTRGMGMAHHAFIGSVALKTAALSAVPVIMVP
ncbi:MAG: universal stress protein [Prosthecobacter sp.]|nr:universal stress protein [Prosthecobacter sp.]